MRTVVKAVSWSLFGIAAVFIFMVLAALAAAGGLISRDAALGLTFLVILTPLTLIGLWMSVAWMRRLDEAAQEAHKWAWFWGGSGGLSLAFVSLAVAPHFGWGLGPETYDEAPISPYYVGAFIAMSFAVAGYLLAWAVWWLKRR